MRGHLEHEVHTLPRTSTPNQRLSIVFTSSAVTSSPVTSSSVKGSPVSIDMASLVWRDRECLGSKVDGCVP